MYERAESKYIKHLDFVLMDILMIQMALILSYVIRYRVLDIYKHKEYLEISILSIIVNLLMIVFNKSYKDILKRGYFIELGASIAYMCCCSVLTVAGILLVRIEYSMSIIMILMFWVIGIVTLYIGRILLKWVVIKWVLPNKVKRYMTILTTREEANNIITKIKSNTCSRFKIKQIFIIDGDKIEEEIMGIYIKRYDEEDLKEYLKEEVVDEIFFSLPKGMGVPKSILAVCYKMGIIIHMNLMSMNEEMESEISEMFEEYTVLTSSIKIAKPYEVFIKRSMDIIGGFIGVLLTGILTLIIGPMIYLKDPGPIFFSQIRVGKNGRKFNIYKFRSMYLDAEKRKTELMDQNEMNGLMFKMTKDPRILPIIGEKIRSWSLDEFPQFLNVLKGDMSLVGTRPPTLDEWEKYEYHHCKRLATKPGVTGNWQVNGRSDITNFEEIVELDTQYIKEWSILLDIKILMKTILVVIGKCGSR